MEERAKPVVFLEEMKKQKLFGTHFISRCANAKNAIYSWVRQFQEQAEVLDTSTGAF
jgi:hypothetical protein